jgi:hypothetical protein
MNTESTSVLESNLALIDRRHFCPELRSLVLDELQESPPSELLIAKDGSATMRVGDNEGQFLVHSRFDPVSESKEIVAQAQLDESVNVILVFGFGCGHVARALMTETDTDTKIVVIEPDLKNLYWFLAHHDATDILGDDRVNVISVSDPASAASAVMPHLALLTLKSWVPLITPPVVRMHGEFLQEFTRTLDQLTAQQKLGFATAADTSTLFMTNAFLNSEYAASSPGLIHLKACWKGRPAILVSAGPSLEKQLPLLKEVRDNFLLISMGASLNALRNAGIEPHIVVTVDPFPVMYNHFDGIKSEGSWLLSDMAGNHQIVTEFSEKRIFGHSTPGMEQLFAELFGVRGLMMSGGSVANSAFSAAAIMQADPIIMIGQDLAYTGGSSHAPGHFQRVEITDEMAKENPQKYKRVPGYYGEDVYTDDKMNSYRIWFERVIPSIKMSRVINATEGGADIEGAEKRPFAEVVAEYRTDDVVDFDSVVAEVDGFRPVSDKEFRDRVLKLRRQVRSIAKIAEEAAAVGLDLLNANTNEVPDEEKDKLKLKYNRQIKQMRRQTGAGDLFITGFLQRGLLFLQRRQALFHKDEGDETFTNYTYQLTLQKACETADALLEKFLARTLH